MLAERQSLKNKVAWGDTIIAQQDTTIARQKYIIVAKDAEIQSARTSEREAKYRADFFQTFAKEQQTITYKTLQKQNKTFLLFGASLGVLITMLITK
jgi:acid phosphatase family membrane protein YuiD